MVKGTVRLVHASKFHHSSFQPMGIRRRNYSPLANDSPGMRLLLILSSNYENKNNITHVQALTGHTISTDELPTTLPEPRLKAEILGSCEVLNENVGNGRRR